MTALLLADILYEGRPAAGNAFRRHRWPADIGMEMITNPHVDLVTFTAAFLSGN